MSYHRTPKKHTREDDTIQIRSLCHALGPNLGCSAALSKGRSPLVGTEKLSVSNRSLWGRPGMQYEQRPKLNLLTWPVAVNGVFRLYYNPNES